MDFLQQISKSLASITDWLIGYSLLLAGVGLASMAIVDAVKGLFSLKEYFHRNMVKRWLARTMSDDKEYVMKTLREVEGEMAAIHHPYNGLPTLQDLNPFMLKPERAVYALDTPKLMAKLQMAAEVKVLRGSASNNTSIKQTGLDVEISIKEQIEKKRKIRELNNSLDTLQIQIIYTWGKLNRFAALCIGAPLMYHILSPLLGGIPLIISSLFGGALAPFAKQLLVSLRQVKRL